MAINARRTIYIRTITISVFMGLFACAIFGYVIKIQVFEAEKWKKVATEFSIKKQKIVAIRGNIFDCNGSLLSTSLPIYDIIIDATAPSFAVKDTFDKYIDSLSYCFYSEFKEEEKAKSVSEYKNIFKAIRSNKNGYYFLKKRVTHQQILRVKKFPLFRIGKITGGLIIKDRTTRVKPFQSLAFRTIGFVNEDAKKYVGLEGFFNEYLSGKNGVQMTQRVSGGVYVPINNEEKEEAENGCDIISTIDINLQDVAQQSLLKVLQKNMAMRGTAILMEVETGEIKAIANLTRKADGTYEESLNDAIRTRMQPGSTFKLVTMMSLLDNSFVTPASIVNVEGGKAMVYGRLVEDSHEYSELNMQQAFEMSSNVAFAKQIAKFYDNNPTKHYDFLDKIGLDKNLQLQMIGALPPFYLKPSSKQWNKSDLSAISRGYGISLTPLQILTFYNAVANNGVMVNPYFVKTIMKAGKLEKEFTTQVLNKQICKKSTVSQLRNMMEGVVKSGTAFNKENANLPYTFAGKTGTAIIQKGEDYYQGGAKVYRASWCGYFPAEKPKYSCYVVVIRPQGSMIYGAQLALPVFKDLANKIYATTTNIHKDVRETYTVFSNDLPQVSKAYKGNVKTILDEVGISSHLENDSIDDMTTNWLNIKQKDNALSLYPVINIAKQMPDVKGMSAKDATYLLESKGLKVSINGFGKVKQQSVKAGSVFNKGSKVNLILG
ncbi:MAG: penicillin-binding protein [Bacteroidia bacterium]